MTGVLRPRIYLPIRLLSDYHEEDLRYILLHELTHYRHLDVITGYLMNLAGTLYWFHPLVWVSLRAMRQTVNLPAMPVFCLFWMKQIMKTMD
mgnify:FL=1